MLSNSLYFKPPSICSGVLLSLKEKMETLWVILRIIEAVFALMGFFGTLIAIFGQSYIGTWAEIRARKRFGAPLTEQIKKIEQKIDDLSKKQLDRLFRLRDYVERNLEASFRLEKHLGQLVVHGAVLSNELNYKKREQLTEDLIEAEKTFFGLSLCLEDTEEDAEYLKKIAPAHEFLVDFCEDYLAHLERMIRYVGDIEFTLQASKANGTNGGAVLMGIRQNLEKERELFLHEHDKQSLESIDSLEVITTWLGQLLRNKYSALS